VRRESDYDWERGNRKKRRKKKRGKRGSRGCGGRLRLMGWSKKREMMETGRKWRDIQTVGRRVVGS
jgi:hypothetical protein